MLMPVPCPPVGYADVQSLLSPSMHIHVFFANLPRMALKDTLLPSLAQYLYAVDKVSSHVVLCRILSLDHLCPPLLLVAGTWMLCCVCCARPCRCPLTRPGSQVRSTSFFLPFDLFEWSYRQIVIQMACSQEHEAALVYKPCRLEACLSPSC